MPYKLSQHSAPSSHCQQVNTPFLHLMQSWNMTETMLTLGHEPIKKKKTVFLTPERPQKEDNRVSEEHSWALVL